jgi:hypothetical protein
VVGEVEVLLSVVPPEDAGALTTTVRLLVLGRPAVSVTT